jgi:hypothetical protein
MPWRTPVCSPSSHWGPRPDDVCGGGAGNLMVVARELMGGSAWLELFPWFFGAPGL